MDESSEDADVSRESRDSGAFEDQFRKLRKNAPGLLDEEEEEQSFHPDTPAFDADALRDVLPQLSEKRERETLPANDLRQSRVGAINLAIARCF
jgi:hypothetical protein